MAMAINLIISDEHPVSSSDALFEALNRVTPLYEEYLNLIGIGALLASQDEEPVPSTYSPLGLVVWAS